MQSQEIERALLAVGQLLEAEEAPARLVIIGGAALNLLGIVERATRDVDVVAMADKQDRRLLMPPDRPFEPTLLRAIAEVGRDFGLPEGWMNAGPAAQWEIGLPPGFADRVSWRQYAALEIGLADREDLIAMKLEAAADQPDANSRHFRDLLALSPTPTELEHALRWVREKNVGPDYHHSLNRVVQHVEDTLDHPR